MPPALMTAKRPLLSRCALLAILWSSWLFPADAQSNVGTCSNRVLVGYVYAVMLHQGSYEYRAYIRKLTRGTLGWTMSLGSFPKGIRPPLEHPMHGVLAPHAGETLRIGRGPIAAINLNTVEVLYDRTGGTKPLVSLHSCTAPPH